MTFHLNIVREIEEKTRGISIRKLLWLLEHGSMVSRGEYQTARTERWRKREKLAAFRVQRIIQGETVTPAKPVAGKPAVSGTLAYAARRGRIEGELRRLRWFVYQQIPEHPAWPGLRKALRQIPSMMAHLERLERSAGLTSRGSLRQDLDSFVEVLEAEIALAVLDQGGPPPPATFSPVRSGVYGDIGI